MISYIKGSILNSYATEKDLYYEIFTAGGLGYTISVPKRYEPLGVDTEITMFLSHQVREDSESLFGFYTQDERNFFQMLLSVSGVGPKAAIGLLSYYSAEELRDMILLSDDSRLSKVPGLGSKTAKKIIIELQGKVEGMESGSGSGRLRSRIKMKNEGLEEALSSLGFSGKELRQMLENADRIEKERPEATIEEILKSVLSQR